MRNRPSQGGEDERPGAPEPPSEEALRRADIMLRNMDAMGLVIGPNWREPRSLPITEEEWTERWLEAEARGLIEYPD